MRNPIPRLVPTLAAALLLTATANATTFVVRPGGDTKVVFVSRAPTETFEGRTDRMRGRLDVEPAAVGDSITVHMEVDMASLDTGLAKRNQHMLENHLETKKYPKAIFDGAAVLGPARARLAPGQTTVFEAEGTFTLHGVSRRLRINVAAAYDARGQGGRISFQTTFPVLLPDYQISRPQFLFLKLAESQEVRVKGIATVSP